MSLWQRWLKAEGKRKEDKLEVGPMHKLEGNKLTITLDLDSTKLSSSGKTIMLATSNGFVWEGDIGISYNIVKRK